MKVAVLVLLACVAASQAAFSGKLVDRAQPLLNQAMFKIRLTTRSSSGMNTEIIAALQEQVNHVLAQIESGVAIAEGVYNGLVQQLASLQSELSGFISGGGQQLSEIASNLLEGLGNIWSSIFGRSVAGRINLDTIIDYVQNLIGSLDIPALIHQVAAHFNIPPYIAQMIIDNFLSNKRIHGKGLFDGISGWISGGASAIWGPFAEFFTEFMAQGTNQLEAVQALAQQFLNQAIAQGQSMAGDAAQQVLDFLAPYAQDLGNLWTQIEAQVNGIVGQIGAKKLH